MECFNPHQLYEEGALFPLQMGKLSQREAKYLAQGLTASKW
jgi:hypothetical protein